MSWKNYIPGFGKQKPSPEEMKMQEYAKQVGARLGLQAASRQRAKDPSVLNKKIRELQESNKTLRIDKEKLRHKFLASNKRGVGAEEAPHEMALRKARSALGEMGSNITSLGGDKNPLVRAYTSLSGEAPSHGFNQAVGAGALGAAGLGTGALIAKRRAAEASRQAAARASQQTLPTILQKIRAVSGR